jgi:hypothetical protein
LKRRQARTGQRDRAPTLIAAKRRNVVRRGHDCYDGLVASRPLDAAERSELGLSRLRYDRAEITIDVFGLNREGLVESRKGLAATLRSQFENGLAVLREGVDMSLALELLPPVLAVTDNLKYAALRRQLAVEFERRLFAEFDDLLFADEVLGQIRDRLRVPTSSDVADALEARAVEEQLKQSAFDRLEKHRVRVKSSSIENRDDKLVYHHTASVARVEIQNFRNIDHLEFEIPAGDFEQLGWKVLLGENGVGKSSVLQAVALTLMGSKRASTLLRPRAGKPLRKANGMSFTLPFSPHTICGAELQSSNYASSASTCKLGVDL